MQRGLSTLSAYGVGDKLAAARDDDSDEEGLDEANAQLATRMKLRLQLRRWEAQFVQTEGRAASYEDKKLNREYQQLRSQLRQAELEWRAFRQQQQALDDLTSLGSSRSGGASSSRRGSGRSRTACASSRRSSSRTPRA